MLLQERVWYSTLCAELYFEGISFFDWQSDTWECDGGF